MVSLRRIRLFDLEGWRPPVGFKDKNGKIVEDRIYNRTDFDRNIVVDERRKVVAQKITEYLKINGTPFDKTIVFCVDIEHAEGMRSALVNENAEHVQENNKYIMQITGDNQEGKRELDNFIDPAETYPVIATTSKLMTTGIDAQTCKLIVLDSNIGSMTEFKQIVGRGTRIKEEYGKTFFTILDFRSVTDKFADPDFDGEAERIKVVTEDEDFPNPEDEKPPIDDDGNEVIIDKPPIVKPGGEVIPEPTIKIMVNGVNVAILNERVQYVDENGKLIMGSIKDYTKKMVKEQYHSLDEFLNKWNKADRKQVIIDELLEQGIVFDNFKEAINKEMDIFDLICHTAFDQPPLSRTERANNVKKRNYFTKYGDQAQKVLNALLDKYADEGIENIEDMKILQVNPFDEIGSPVEIVKMFGGKKNYLEALNELEHEIYKAA
jgi:type I restriction enzyme R subunit